MTYEMQIAKEVKEILELYTDKKDLRRFLMSYFIFMHRNYGHEEMLSIYHQRIQELVAFCKTYDIDYHQLSNYQIDELLNCLSFECKEEDMLQVAKAKDDNEIEKIMELIEKKIYSTSNFD